MITFKQYLIEADGPVAFDEFIARNCGPFVDAVGSLEDVKSPKYSLYRGMKPSALSNPILLALDAEQEITNTLADFDQVTGYIKSVRPDRRPKDTPSDISRIVDDIFEEKFGWRPRQAGVFCFGRTNHGGVDDYGMRHKVYPMDELDFVYSPTVRDMTLQLAKYMEATGSWHKGVIGPDNLEAATYDIRAFIRDNKYTNTDLKAAMESKGRSEIMVRCRQYLAVPISHN